MLSRGLTTWVKWMALKIRGGRVVRRLLATGCRRRTAMVWSEWCTWAAGRRANDRRFRTSLQRMRKACIAAALGAWVAHVRRRTRIETSAARVFLRTNRCAATRALTAWAQWSRRHRVMIMICARIVARLQYLVTSKAYVAWRSLYIRQVRARRLMARLRHRSASLAFGRWATAAVSARTTAVLRQGDAERAAFHHDLRAAQDLISRRALRWATQRSTL